MQTTISDIKPVINIPAKPWKKNFLPRRILAIRLQAMGDMVITLPYLQQLKKSLPTGSELDLLTRKEADSIPKNIQLFDHVYSIGGGRNVKKQFLYTGLLLPKLLLKRYDVVIDLQNNEISRLVRRTLMPAAWSSFDRFSPVPAGERTRMTIEAVGLGKNDISSGFHFKNHIDPITILKNNGWDGKSKLMVLNPAGAFPTRNWPLENYIAFAALWLHRFPDSQFLILGTSFIASKAAYLKEMLGERMINIINKTTPAEALAI